LNGIEKWNERYRRGEHLDPVPLSFFVNWASNLKPGRALDLACGVGRHAIWLIDHGWSVTALDASEAAIDIMKQTRPQISTGVVDIEQPQFVIEPQAYDLIVDTFFLHRPLFSKIKQGVRPGGVVIIAIHLSGSFAVKPGELPREYREWEILHYIENEHGTAELVARKPSHFEPEVLCDTPQITYG
jgi:tellurite methyltransferase